MQSGDGDKVLRRSRALRFSLARQRNSKHCEIVWGMYVAALCKFCGQMHGVDFARWAGLDRSYRPRSLAGEACSWQVGEESALHLHLHLHLHGLAGGVGNFLAMFLKIPHP